MRFSTLPPDSRTLVSKLNTELALIWKEDFGPLGNSPGLLLLSPGKTPLTSTVAKFLDTSVCGALDALTPASVHSLWSSPKFLNRFCLTILTMLWFSRLVEHLFLPHFFLPLNLLLTCLDTRGGKSMKIFYSSKSTITLITFYLSTSKRTSLKIYSSKSKK